jgi:hypothetical protein
MSICLDKMEIGILRQQFFNEFSAGSKCHLPALIYLIIEFIDFGNDRKL